MTPLKAAAPPIDVDTPVWGAEAIGKVINLPTKAVYHLLDTGKLPARKVGGRWVSTPRRLLAHFANDDASERNENGSHEADLDE